jgi:hypothetical protein
MSDGKTCSRCKQLRHTSEFRQRQSPSKNWVLRSYCRSCEKELNHRNFLREGRCTSQRRWEPVLTEARLAKVVRTESEIRFAARDLEHQLRVFRVMGHTGMDSHY